MAGATAASVDAILTRSEDYFQPFQLQQRLVKALEHLAEEQSQDPVKALGQLLLDSREDKGSGREKVRKLVVVGEQPCDFETSVEEAAVADPLLLLASESLPTSEAICGSDLAQCSHWAGGFNRPLLDGWLRQPSPCCAAASVAGAFNALFDLGRSSAKSASIREVADLMASNCDKLFAQRQQRVERLLGLEQGTFSVVLDKLDGEFAQLGLQWTAGSGPHAITRNVAVRVMREMMEKWSPSDETDPGNAAFVALQGALGVGDTAKADPDVQGNAGGTIVTLGPDWEQELGDLITKRRGSFRLRAELPNTGEIGSWGVKQAATDLSVSRSCDPIQTQVLIGCKGGPKVEMHISKDDSQEAITQQWNALKNAFSRPTSVLLFHLTNHYALVYAWREWQEKQSDALRIRRQILTARKGQKPTAWLDFDEVRSIMLSWSGYHILELQRSELCSHVDGGQSGIPGGA